MSPELPILGLIIVPLAAGVVAFVAGRIASHLAVAVAALQLVLAVLVARSVFRGGPFRYEIGGWGAPLGIDLYADGLSAVMLAMTAIVGLAVSMYATAYFGSTGRITLDHSSREMFWPLELFLFAALNALFLSGDIFNLYITLEILTLTAVALIGLAGSVEALAASLRYLLAAIVASLFYLLGVALLYSVHGVLDWQLLASNVQGNLASRCSIVLIVVGLVLKTALFPLHFWLPSAHASAPAPASALLSGLVLKGSFFVLFRLWFDVFPLADLQAVGHLLGTLGAAGVLWGSVQAIRQRQLKLLVAYSTVAQVGYLFLVFSLAAVPTSSRQAWSATVYFALSHACAKAAAFLAAGSLRYAVGSDDIASLTGTAARHPVTVFAFGLAGVALMGLPPSGAFLAKWLLLDSALSTGQWGIALVILIGGLLASIYVFRVIARSCAATEAQGTRRVPFLMQLTPLVLALFSMGLGVFAMQPLQLLESSAPFSVAAWERSP
jgi:formate hydrogenlyase subunit 3/multisubunit Na+/H+ antiporter MnhD subunit